MASFGRGGAGNIASTKTPLNTDELSTPTLKQDVYTTGRGGSGNMALNDPSNPELARERQDVQAAQRSESHGRSHFGRGGAANTTDAEKEVIEGKAVDQGT